MCPVQPASVPAQYVDIRTLTGPALAWLFKQWQKLPMAEHLLDRTASAPVLTLCRLQSGDLLVSYYDSTIRLYRDNSLCRTVSLPQPIHHILFHDQSVLLFALSGTVYVSDEHLNVLYSFDTVDGVSSVVLFADEIILGSWNRALAVVGYEPDAGKYVLRRVMVTRNRITAMACDMSRIAIGCENILLVYDRHFSVLFEKRLAANINTISMADGGVFLGLISGRIHYEPLPSGPSDGALGTDSAADEAFIFNAHVESAAASKVFHSVNSLVLRGRFLYSAGSDGKVLQWNIRDKMLSAVVHSCQVNIREFFLIGGFLYVIAEDILQQSALSLVLYTRWREI